MCLIALALDAHPRYRLVLAANRDEFHARPSAPASYWDDAPQIFGGRDLQQHGSWLACARDGRWAAVTNVRRMVPPDPRAPSRGALVADYLRGTLDAARYVDRLQANARAYAGFNLLVGEPGAVWYFSNQPEPRVTRLTPGVHAVSNAHLDTPWPKLTRLKSRLQQWCAEQEHDFEPLIAALGDPQQAPDAELPDTGVGLEHERFLSPLFIIGKEYGTRCSTVLSVDGAGHLSLRERRYGPDAAFLGETTEFVTLSR